MKQRISTFILGFAVISGLGALGIYHYFAWKTPDTKPTMFFIQLQCDQPTTISTVRNTITPRINAIIQEELKLADGINFPKFLPPQRQVLTLYYVVDVHTEREGLMTSTLDMLQQSDQKVLAPKQVLLKPQADFFGDIEDHVVIHIHDPKQELTVFNAAIKDVLHRTNDSYMRDQNHVLYDLKKSEQFSYIPHIDLGRIQIKWLKKFINNPAIEDKIVETIKQRIKTEIFPLIESLVAKQDKKIEAHNLCVFDVLNRKCLKMYPLSSEQKK